MKNNEQACDAQPRREATANQFSQGHQADTTVSIANYVINTAAIGIFNSKTTISQALLPLPRGEGWGEGLADAQSLGIPPVSLADVYLRPTAGYLPCKFFEITRDGESSELKAVSTRLPKNFQCKHPALSASSVRALKENTKPNSSFPSNRESSASLAPSHAERTVTTNFVANYVINTAAIGIFGNKPPFDISSETAFKTNKVQTWQSFSNQQPERLTSGELIADEGYPITNPETAMPNHTASYRAAGVFGIVLGCLVSSTALLAQPLSVEKNVSSKISTVQSAPFVDYSGKKLPEQARNLSGLSLKLGSKFPEGWISWGDIESLDEFPGNPSARLIDNDIFVERYFNKRQQRVGMVRKYDRDHTMTFTDFFAYTNNERVTVRCDSRGHDVPENSLLVGFLNKADPNRQPTPRRPTRKEINDYQEINRYESHPRACIGNFQNARKAALLDLNTGKLSAYKTNKKVTCISPFVLICLPAQI